MDKFIIINVHDATPKKSLIFSSFVFFSVWKKIHVKNNDYFYIKKKYYYYYENYQYFILIIIFILDMVYKRI
jgi:hypothetical protein